MKINNKRGAIFGVMTVILTIVCIVVYFISHEQRFLASALLLLALTVMNFMGAFSKKGALEELAENTDERDLYLTMKSSHLVIHIMNYIICTCLFVSLVLYGFFKNTYLITIATTLCMVLALMFFVFLGVNIYFEKHE